MRQKDACGADQAVNIGLEHGFELVFRHFFDCAIYAVAGVVDQYIDMPEGCNGLPRGYFNFGRLGHVEREGPRRLWVFGLQVLHFCQVPRGSGHPLPAFEQFLSQQPSEAGGGAGNKPGSSRICHLSLLRALGRLRVRCPRQAWDAGPASARNRPVRQPILPAGNTCCNEYLKRASKEVKANSKGAPPPWRQQS